jgi:membrane protein DedA with SNARE-associated domain
MIETIQKILSGGTAGLAEMSPYLIIAALFALTFVSEDAACLGAGTLAAQGRIALGTAILTCFAGIVVGDVALYWIGRVTGAGILKARYLARFVSDDSIDRAGNWLERKGAAAVFTSRFATGLRLPTYLAAGFFRTSFRSFFAYFLLAAAVWTPIAVGVSYFSTTLITRNVFVAVFVGFIAVRLMLELLARENRRLLFGRLKRLVKWEFWPVHIFYLPVIIYCVLLSIRFRSLTVFTAANPGIASGGFVGESKDEIYKLLAGSSAARNSMLEHCRVAADLTFEARIGLAAEFIRRHRLSLPVVLKPDVGERGKGVTIARTWEEAAQYLSAAAGDTIVQEFFGGVEASVFYFRFPGEQNGNIFSITEKLFPSVIGDGTSDLRTLIINDGRAVALAKSYFQQNRDRLDFVPAAGESVRLIDIGTHSRGAIFTDGGRLRTEKLERAIDEICRGVDGFYFGRFDLRARSFEDFQNGGPFRIIELNGVSSESTNIYDRKYDLLGAYKILFAQWRLAFEIGDANRKLGVEPTSIFDLGKLTLRLKLRPGVTYVSAVE